MFVVLGASGNTGKVVAETLLRQKKKVRVVLFEALDMWRIFHVNFRQRECLSASSR
jgi:short subunit dehydrogenase-like uncharacterized protein